MLDHVIWLDDQTWHVSMVRLTKHWPHPSDVLLEADATVPVGIKHLISAPHRLVADDAVLAQQLLQLAELQAPVRSRLGLEAGPQLTLFKPPMPAVQPLHLRANRTSEGDD